MSCSQTTHANKLWQSYQFWHVTESKRAYYAPDKRHYWLINNLVALHEKHPIILTHFIPSQCVLFFTSHVRFVNSIPSFFVSKTTTTSPFSFSQERFVYDLSLSLSRSILWPSGVNVKSNVQGMLSVPAHIHNFFRSCMRCLITFT